MTPDQQIPVISVTQDLLKVDQISNDCYGLSGMIELKYLHFDFVGEKETCTKVLCNLQ